MEAQRNILVTTALPYANGPIHLGHMVEYIQADVWVRFQRMRGNNCFFFCADDTHGTPILIRARKENRKPEDVIGEIYKSHIKDFAQFGISFDNYSSTNTETNRAFCEEIYGKMNSNGHCAVKQIKQTYCPNDKMFLPDRFIKGTCPNCGSLNQYGDSCDVCSATYSPTELKDSACAICGTKPILKESDHVFFKLNDFKDFLREWVPNHTSSEVSKKLNEWLQEELRDWDISRDEPYFGFKIPGYTDKYFYVWVDAPIGYMASAKDYFDKKGDKNSFAQFWNKENEKSSELYHFIGKDIVYFHTLFWPAMLHTAGYRTPTAVNVHGFLTVNGEKMSKSKGTFVNAETYLKYLDPSYLRYYYACKLTDGMDDIDMNLEDFAQRVNSDLVGKYVNLGSRSAQMLQKSFGGQITTFAEEGLTLYRDILAKSDEIAALYDARQFSKAINLIRECVDRANKYFDDVSPWKMAKENPQAAQECLNSTLWIFRTISIYLTPVIPELSQKVADLFGDATYTWKDLLTKPAAKTLHPFSHLIQRVELEKVQKMIDETKVNATATEATAAKTSATAPKSEPAFIEIDDFNKIDLRVAKVLAAEDVVGTDKMLKLRVSIGTEEKTIFAGIKKSYKPEQLVGKQVLVVANLKPRQMKFGLSEGMVLCASSGEQLFVMSPETGADTGSKVK
jgi:methionyl-tRNA synthetase